MVSENRIKKIPKTNVHFMTGSALIPRAAPKDKQETSKYIKVANISILSLIAGYNMIKKKLKYISSKKIVNFQFIFPFIIANIK